MFLKNRVDEMKERSYPGCSDHCPGNENPADTLSRGEIVISIKDQELWSFGLRWII